MMQPVTKADLLEFTQNRALPEYIDALIAGWPRIQAVGVNTSLRWCHFIAQVMAETGLRLTRESTRWTPAQMKALWPSRFPLGAADPRIMLAKGDERKLANVAYSGRKDIGNQGGDDGWDYRGGGLLQITGRATYRECGLAIGVDLESEPGLIERADVGLAAALWVWGRHPNNQFADRNYGRTIGNAINRGNPYAKKDPIDYGKRQQWFDRAWALWGEGQALPDASTLHLGAWGPKVGELQVKLRSRGYAVGAVDGNLGPATARAIAGFKLDATRNGASLEAAEIVGPLTMAALDGAQLAPLSPERLDATVEMLAAAGSTEVKTGKAARATGQAGLYLGAAAGAAQLGLLDQVNSWLSSVGLLHTMMVPAIDAIKWGTQNFLWAGCIVGGVWFWVRGRDVISARLRAHQSGANLGR
jgi:putative chitinase